jgi:hypothetical protein
MTGTTDTKTSVGNREGHDEHEGAGREPRRTRRTRKLRWGTTTSTTDTKTPVANHDGTTDTKTSVGNHDGHDEHEGARWRTTTGMTTRRLRRVVGVPSWRCGSRCEEFGN